MSNDKLERYRHPQEYFPERNTVWPLYGAGFENFGRDDQPIDIPMREYGDDELLVRHDACGLCFSDIKLITLGENHPRIYRNMRENPTVQGHEVAMTVIGVGEKLRGQYKVGDRFTIQSDIFVNGIGYAYGYEIQGGMSRYGVIDQRILNGDGGNYLLPVQQKTGYAESALTEPWACVVAAYQLRYRNRLQAGGTTWIIGQRDDTRPYTLQEGFDASGHPARLVLSGVPASFAAELKARAAALGVEVIETDDLANPGFDKADDIILLGTDADALETASLRLADGGVFAIIADQPMPRKVNIDSGRVHYNRWVYVGGTTPDIHRAYTDTPVRSEYHPNGRSWFVGAAGPMGRMHVQRAIQVANGPSLIICTDVSPHRLQDLYDTFAAEAQAKGIEFICLNPKDPADAAKLAAYKPQGFDDIIVLAPVAALIADAVTYLAPKGVMNVFAGVGRGTMVNMDVTDIYMKDVRYVGQSGSLIEDLRLTLSQAESGELSTNRAVAAIGSLSATKVGLEALRDAVYPGKIVIYSHIKEMPITALPDLKDVLPTVYAKLKDGREWTNEAEDEFLRLMLE